MQRHIVFLMVIFTFSSAPVFAQSSNQGDQSDEPSGLEARKVSEGVTVLMPKGGRMHRTNETTYVQESTDEYAARNFASVEKRLDNLEKDNIELKKKVDDINSKPSPDKNVLDTDKE